MGCTKYCFGHSFPGSPQISPLSLFFSRCRGLFCVNVSRNSSVGKFQCSLHKCPWDTGSRKDPTKGSCWIVMLSSRKLAITIETISQESTQLSKRTQLSGIWFPVRERAQQAMLIGRATARGICSHSTYHPLGTEVCAETSEDYEYITYTSSAYSSLLPCAVFSNLRQLSYRNISLSFYVSSFKMKMSGTELGIFLQT